MTLRRHHIGFLLALALLITGHSATARRLGQEANGQVVLWTGSGAVPVLVDQSAAPVAPPYYCPDCTTQLLALVADPAEAVAVLARVRPAEGLAPRALRSLAAGSATRARAPPLA